MSNIKDKIITIFFACVIFLIVMSLPIYIIGESIYYNTAGRESLIEYNNDDYYYVNATVGSGTTENFYFGAITKEDYNKWKNGDSGTIWINKLSKENYGYRINIDNITSIMIYDKENDCLPVNFF